MREKNVCHNLLRNIDNKDKSFLITNDRKLSLTKIHLDIISKFKRLRKEFNI